MEEIGLEIGKHKPRRFEDLEDGSFDLVITLSPEAQHKAMELTRTAATRWNIGRPRTPRRSKARASSGWRPTGRCATS